MSPHSSGTVLVVDDDETVRAMLDLALRELSDHIVCCSCAEEAEAILARTRVDLVCIDKHLPRTHGLELVRSIRTTDAAIGILVITGYGSLEGARASLELGVDGYIEKPFDVERLLLSCQTTLARAARRREAIRAGGRYREIRTGLVIAPHEILAATLGRSLRAAGLEDGGLGSEVDADLVLLAIDRPQGIPARVSELRRRHPAAEIVVLASQYDLTTLTSLMDLGVAATLDLPVETESLDECLVRLIGTGSRAAEVAGDRF